MPQTNKRSVARATDRPRRVHASALSHSAELAAVAVAVAAHQDFRTGASSRIWTTMVQLQLLCFWENRKHRRHGGSSMRQRQPHWMHEHSTLAESVPPNEAVFPSL
mmetsp:Transcript_17363/g.25738  ORF Transcript_17363/g.25738 Transcript_17363/m.25738 type:complete len:106 (+) Transcript_17363:310-627(+)